jgi:phenylacetate-CoA ligase
METMDPEQRETIILEKLRHQVRYAYQNSAFYREVYRDADVDPTNLRSFDDFRRLPILTKEHLRREQEAHPPFGRYLCVPPERVLRIHGTSGTTGRPSVFGFSADDWERIGEAHARVMWSAGVRPGDRIIISAVFSAYMGSWATLAGAEWLGAQCFPFGAGAPGQTERTVEWAALVKPTVLYGTPSFALYLASTARRMGMDPRRDLAFRLMLFSGEPGASIPATRKEIEETFGCTVVDQGTLAEMTPWCSSSGCRHLKRGMHLWQDIVYCELLDPATKSLVPFGGEGVPVYTHLERTSQPMLRYWSGDLAQWDMAPCACGRTYPTLPQGIYGRVDDMIIVRAQNVFPAKIEDVLRGLEEFGGEFRLVLERDPGQMDKLTVQAEVLPKVYATREEDPAAFATVESKFGEELRRALGVSAAVELKPQGEFERTQLKSRRVIDKRKYWKG